MHRRTAVAIDRRKDNPILTNFNQGGNALYVAAPRIGAIYCFACVEDGNSSVVFTDEPEVGDEHETHESLVLVLHYDPSDLALPYPRIYQLAL